MCTDLDEVLFLAGEKKLENLLDKNVTKLAYNYNWYIDEYGNPKVNFYTEKIHSRFDYKWTYPVHEVLTYIVKEKEVIKTTDEITLNHFPDHNKSRASYLPLLELSVKENPEDDRNMHYWNIIIKTGSK